MFGLAFRAISRLNAPTAFEMLAPHLDEEMFAFSVPTDTLAGELVLGGVDESRFVGDLQWIDVSTPHKYWQAALTSASIGAQQLAGSAAVFDTGTTLLVTTEANAWALAGALDAWCYAWVNATSSYDVRRCAEADAAVVVRLSGVTLLGGRWDDQRCCLCDSGDGPVPQRSTRSTPLLQPGPGLTFLRSRLTKCTVRRAMPGRARI